MAAHHTLRKILCIWLTVGLFCAYAFNPPTGWQITELYDGNAHPALALHS